MSRFCWYATSILAVLALGAAPAAAQSEWASLRLTNLEMRDPCGSGGSRHVDVREALSETLRAYEESVCSTLGRGDRPKKLTATKDIATGEDPVEDELRSMGRNGFLIARAREEVSEILREESACSAWYRQEEPDAPRKFRSLRFITEEGKASIEAHYDYQGSLVVHEPYVARVQQLVGPGSTVTLNAHGAFFERDAPVGRRMRGGGPVVIQPNRCLHVGDYLGGTLRAQVTTLLHEYAHIVGLLPVDAGYPEAPLLSTRNTRMVLAHCQKEIDMSESRMIVLPEALAALTPVKRRD